METEAGPNGNDGLSTSSSTTQGGEEYEVFLNFRGLDTRHSFTDFLYTYLVDNQVRTFRDNNKLHIGEEIGPELLKAIRESKISIPIFSENYASSKWCLRELAQMVDCRKTMGRLILPIFYDVQPSDVKDQDGIYDKALRELQKSESLDDDTIEQWKEALRVVAGLKGMDVKKQADGYQGKLIKDVIVPRVLLELKNCCMILPDNLVGMDHHEDEMMRLLKIGSNDVRIVGIHGMVGIGKTTIAKFIYNKLFKHFECHSFLVDIRETVQQNGLVNLQKKFFTDTLKCPIDIADVDTGIGMIDCRYRGKKVLVVLDDVNESSQYRLLVGKPDCYGRGSRIIVTTRDKHVLNVLEVDATYEPPFMNPMQSLQLFIIHAFRRKSPPKEYDGISEEVASTAAGLPLALERTGSFLSDKNPLTWQDILEKLKKKPHDEVEKKLRESYEALNNDQKQIFLDISCLFDGTDKATVFYMWDDCGYHPETEFNVLSLLSLVKVGDANELRMHYQLSALGRNVVCEEKILGKRSRLWNHDEALDILQGQMGTKRVEAVSLCFELESRNRPIFTRKDFKKLKCLRYLQVDGADLAGDFRGLLFHLRWLNWRGCSPYFQLTNICLKNLVILDLSNSGITEDWGGWSHFKMAKKLKVLQLAYCALRRTPDFSSHVALEILILRHCESLVEIDRSIGNVKNLKVLDISYSDIRMLPDEIWTLEKLEVIDFTNSGYLRGDVPSYMGRLSSLRFLSFCGTKIQSLPRSIGRLCCLQTLNIGDCTDLQSLPDLPSSLRILYIASIPNLTNLVNLLELYFVEGCEDADIPGEIGNLSKLEKLTFHSTKIRILPKEIGVLSHLKVLDVQFCDDLQCILGLPSSLVDLSLAYCDSLERLPDLSNLKHLSKLLLHNCEGLAEVQGLGKLESLTSLNINACEMLANLGDMSNLSKLIALSITNCPRLVGIQGLAKLELLRYLDLHGCQSLCQIDGLEDLGSLEVFDVLGCPLETIPNLPNTPIQRCDDHIYYHGDTMQRCSTALEEERFNFRLQE